MDLYNAPAMREVDESGTLLHRLYTDWLEGAGSKKAKQVLYTEYHEVEPMDNPLTIKW